MPKLVINPLIPNDIHLIDYKIYSKPSEERSKELTSWYEKGDLIIVTNYQFLGGRDIFNKVLFRNQKGLTKLLLHLDAQRHGEAPREREWNSVQDQLDGRDVTFEQFQEAVRSANEELMNLSDTLFPYYKYDKRFCIYNLSEMLAHNMHFDSPQHAEDFTQLRAFVNLDDFPRIWRVGERLETMVDECYRSAHLEKTIGKHLRYFTRKTTLATYGDRYQSGAHRYPMHSIAFQPGEVWFLNPNMRAHEVVYGRRILDGVFLFDGSGLLNRDRFYPTMVDQMHKKHLGRTHYWLRKQKARIENHIQMARSSKPRQK